MSDERASANPLQSVYVTSFEPEKRAAFCITQTGQSHAEKQMPCQDASWYGFTDGGIHIFVISDGVGSCVHSQTGAQIAAKSAGEYLRQKLEKVSADMVSESQMMPRILKAMHLARQAVKVKASQMKRKETDFLCTLTIGIYCQETLYYGHIGDDGIVAVFQNGTYEMITKRHKGEEASSVYPLQASRYWQTGKAEHVSAFFLATDGVLDLFVGSAYEKNRVFYPFLRSVYEPGYGSRQEAEQLFNELNKSFLSPRFRSRVLDDITFAGFIDLQARSHSAIPSFDKAAWMRQNEEIRQKRQNMLYR